MGIENPGARLLWKINTSGYSQFGLEVDEDLKMAVVGQVEKGVDVIKLGNPEIKFVYKDESGTTYKEVIKISPSGIKGVLPVGVRDRSHVIVI